MKKVTGGDNPSENLYGAVYFQAREDDEKRLAWYKAEHNRIVGLRPEGGSIFDVGCGVGAFLDQFDQSKWQRYGVDVSEFASEYARSRGITVKPYKEGYDYPDESFDVIIFRGTVQHLDTPFTVIKKCAALLKSGGLMAFLSTPNSKGICYRLFGELPFLNPDLNYLIPSDQILKQSLVNFGLTVTETRYPYLETPYARPLRDHLFFLLRCTGIKVKFAFWRNIMEVYAIKDTKTTVAVI